jgi:molecular chaperone GrpE
MTDPTVREPETVDAAAAPEAAAAAAPTTEEKPDPLAEAQREAAEFKDKALRTLAEMENLRKRTAREVAEARIYGIAGFARDILVVADNMHRAMQALDEELRAKGEERIKALLDGVELTERELMKVLEKHGVRRFSPDGERFDPNLHQAMFEMEHAELPPGHVGQVIQAGYMLGDRVLRPALVAVVKAPPKPEPAPAPVNDNLGAEEGQGGTG